jgi:hypothetical protein
MKTITPLCSPPLTAVRCSAARGRFWLCVTDVFLFAMFLIRAIPETLLPDEKLGIAGVPFGFCIFYSSCLAAALSALQSPKRSLSLPIATATFIFLYMAVVGQANGNEWKFFVIDSSYFAGLLLGILWASQRTTAHALWIFRFILKHTTVLLLLTCIGLISGFIPPARGGDRIFSFSIFGSTTIICTLAPLILVTSPFGSNKETAQGLVRWVITGLSTVLLAAVISATRSMLLVWLCSIGAIVWLTMDWQKAIKYLIVILIFSPLATMLLVSCGHENNRIAQRLQSTEFGEELRYVELQMMFDQLGDDVYLGKGFGSRFDSPIGREQIAFAPHIGIMTLLYKGGVSVFLLVILLPIAFALVTVLYMHGTVWRSREQRLLVVGCLAGVLINAAQACMSAGWDYQHLYLYGALLAIARQGSGFVSLGSGTTQRGGALAVLSHGRQLLTRSASPQS